MKRALRPLALVLIAMLSFAISATCAFASQDSHRVIKVGVYGNSVYAYQDENGVWRGVDIECLTNIAQREGLTMEFIDSVNDPDFLANLDNGTYDILCDVVNTPDREERFLFSDAAVGSTSGANLAVRADDTRWDYGNIEQVSSMKIGLVSSFSNNDTFRSWCSDRGLTPQFVEYSSIGDMSTALENGEIDGEVYGAFYGDASKVRTILDLAPVDVYYVFRKNDVELKNKIDEAMNTILLEDPYYLSDLNNKYHATQKSSVLPFSKAEQEYISTHGTVKVAVMGNDRPYYWEAKDGSDCGIVPDYCSLVASQTGLQFDYIVYDSFSDEIAAVLNGQADMIGIYSNGIISASSDGLLISQSYSTTSNTMLTRTGTSTSDIKTIAIISRSSDAVSSILAADFPDAQIQDCNNASECFDLLASGKVDAMVCSLPSATWLMNQTNSSAYVITPLSGASSDFCCAVSTENRTLCTILNKGISATKTSYDGIVTADTLPANDLRSFIERIPAWWLAVASAILLALVLALVIMLVLLRRRQKEKSAIAAEKVENERKAERAAALEKSAEEKNEFFSNISHDMRTPLNAIIGFSGLAKGSEVSPEEKDEYLSKIQTSGNLMLALVNDTLTLSKINSRKFDLKPAPAYTEDIGAVVITPIREAAAQKNLTFYLDKSGYRPRTILVDSLNLEKIFLNLLSNAIKYTPSGGHVWATVFDDPANSADPDMVFVIRDDGIGISDEFFPHLFEPFATEGRAGSEVTGTGLGLSIVKSLVDLMGGTISVESKVNQGTAFMVRLHFTEVEAAERAPQHEMLSSTSGLSGKHVLLCEDNSVNAEVAGLMLGKMGVSYDVAADGRQGLEAFEKSEPGSYDAILMDVRMPVMNGVEATRAIRALQRADAASIPIIALTADAFDDDIDRDRNAGMNAHVSKPIDPDELAHVLAEQIEKASGTHANRTL